MRLDAALPSRPTTLPKSTKEPLDVVEYVGRFDKDKGNYVMQHHKRMLMQSGDDPFAEGGMRYAIKSWYGWCAGWMVVCGCMLVGLNGVRVNTVVVQ